MYKVYFISDLHLSHKNILKYQPNRMEMMGLTDVDDIEKHDEYILNMWKSTLKRGDHVYVLGDMILANYEQTKKLMNQLKSTGCKIHLIIGNHDKKYEFFSNLFESIDTIKYTIFKKSTFDFLDADFRVVMCHYPLVTWQHKTRGCVCLHGHTHNHSPWENEGVDLRLNVGFDSTMSNGKLISLEEIYAWYKEKLHGLSPFEYIEECSRNVPTFVR